MGQHLTSKVSVALVGELDVVIDRVSAGLENPGKS
jgi:hypothetical protein